MRIIRNRNSGLVISANNQRADGIGVGSGPQITTAAIGISAHQPIQEFACRAQMDSFMAMIRSKPPPMPSNMPVPPILSAKHSVIAGQGPVQAVKGSFRGARHRLAARRHRA